MAMSFKLFLRLSPKPVQTDNEMVAAHFYLQQCMATERIALNASLEHLQVLDS